ncbi:MAG: ECF transporter S component [Oscillospiraceae bacterium]|nr:ECF transporter S component [Oscillospiraceae bacterium]
MKLGTKEVTGLAMVSAIAYVVMLAGFRFMPTAQFLKYEAKDVILTIGGFIYGPLGAVAASFVVAMVEMLTISETGPIGFMMNFLAAASYAAIASAIYKKVRTPKGAVAGLALGSLSLCVVMLLWNYIITPIYMNVPRPVVEGMLLPVFLPFNLIKAGLNTAFVLLIYKPLMTALRAARLLPDSAAGRGQRQKAGSPQEQGETAGAKFRVNASLYICAVSLLACCAIAIYLVRRFSG